MTGSRIAAFSLLAWCLAVWAGPELSAGLHATVSVANSAGHVPYADTRTFAGLAYAADVLSNLPFAIMGLIGAIALARRQADMAGRLPRPVAWGAGVFFAGLLFTAMGSAWYHLAPDTTRLVWDRLGMGVGFAGMLTLVAQRWAGPQAGWPVLATALPLALVSAVLPHTHGNVVPWALVQFGGMGLLLAAALHRGAPADGALPVRFGVIVTIYALAKWFEGIDEGMFEATGHWVSGHTLKHLTAALAAWPVIAAVVSYKRRT